MQKNIKTFHLIHDKYLFFCIVNTLIEKEKSQKFSRAFQIFLENLRHDNDDDDDARADLVELADKRIIKCGGEKNVEFSFFPHNACFVSEACRKCFGSICVGIGRCLYLHTELLSRRCFSFKQTQILEFAWFDGEGGASRVSSKKAQKFFRYV